MADLARIKRNVAKMVSMNAPEGDIDAYIQSEGVTVDDVRNFKDIRAADGPPPGAIPGSREYADWAAAQARAGKSLPQVSEIPAGPSQTRPLDQIEAGYTSAVNALPIVGPYALGGLQSLKAGMQGRTQDQVAAEDAAREQANSGASMTGAVMGSVLPFMVGGEIPLVAKGLGMDAAMPLWGRMLAGGLSTGAISGADTLARGGDLGQVAQDAGIGGVIGAAIPGAGAVVRSVARAAKPATNWILGGVPELLNNARNPTRAAQKVIGRAMVADRNAGLTMGGTEEATARANGVPLVNLDLGGPATRRLARVASSQSPEAKSIMQGAVDRGAPGLDTGSFLQKLVGGSADDLAFREGLRNTARMVNDPAYRRAYSAPEAGNILTPGIQQLMLAPEMQAAIREAEGIGRTRAAISGAPRVAAPFKFDANGNMFSTPIAPPSLQFWDNVQQALRRQMEALGPKERARLSDLTSLRNGLLEELDATVPDFQTARRGAASFFGAEDALDAGRQFALQPRNLPEAAQAFAKFSAPEKKAFAVGAASSVIDALKAGNDSYAVVKKMFGNEASRQFWRMTLGKQKAGQLENFVKVQALMDASKRALEGNSHTYDLMVAGGLGSAGLAGSFFAPGNNLSNAAFFAAALRAGRGVLGRKVDQQVAENVAKLLASGDKDALNKVIVNASMSPKWQIAVDAIMRGVGIFSRGEGVMATRQNMPPQLTDRAGIEPTISPLQ